MNPPELLELLPETEISGASESVFGGAYEVPVGYYEDCVKRGTSKATLVNFDGLPVYRIIWQKVFGSQISILLLQALKNPADINLAGMALDALAASEKATAVIFSTGRKALYAQARTWGAEPKQVVMVKKYA